MSSKSPVEVSESQSQEICELVNHSNPAMVHALAVNHVRSTEGGGNSKVSFAKMKSINLNSFTLTYVECQSGDMCMMNSAVIQFDPPLDSGKHF